MHLSISICVLPYAWMLVISSSFLFTLNAQDLSALAVQARENLYIHWNFSKSEQIYNKIIDKPQTPAFAYSDYGWYLMLINQEKKGLSYIREASEMDSSDKQLVTWYAWALLWNGRINHSEKVVLKALEIDDHYGEALYVYSMILSKKKHHEKALKYAKKASLNDSNWRAAVPLALAEADKMKDAKKSAGQIGKEANAYDAIILSEVFAVIGEDDNALDYLNKALHMRHPFVPWMYQIPSLKHLHQDPAFRKIAIQINLPASR